MATERKICELADSSAGVVYCKGNQTIWGNSRCFLPGLTGKDCPVVQFLKKEISYDEYLNRLPEAYDLSKKRTRQESLGKPYLVLRQ